MCKLSSYNHNMNDLETEGVFKIPYKNTNHFFVFHSMQTDALKYFDPNPVYRSHNGTLD